MSRWALRTTSAVVISAAAFSLSGCGPESGDGPDPGPTGAHATGSALATDELPREPTSNALGLCSDYGRGYEAIGYEGQSPAMQELYQEIVVCSNGPELVLLNQSDGVWVFDPSVTVQLLASSNSSHLFRTYEGLLSPHIL